MAYLFRRTFLERMCLGAGAFVLGPMVTKLVREAHGAAPRKRLIAYTFSNGWFRLNSGITLGGLVPAEFMDKKISSSSTYLESKSFAKLPPFAEAFSPWRDKLLIVDGLVNQQGAGGHGCGDFFTCVPPSEASESGYARTGGKSFDQHLSETMGRGMPFSSIHLGASTDAKDAKVMSTPFFAKGKNQPVPVQLSPVDAFAGIFPAGPGGGGADADRALKRDLAARGKLFDHIREDIGRVKGRLAASERLKMDEYLSALEEAQGRLSALANNPAATGSCGAAPDKVGSTTEAMMEAQVDVAAAALICGMTNVLTLSFIGIGKAFSQYGGTASLHAIGHGDISDSDKAHAEIVMWHSRQVARLTEKLSSFPEGNGTMLDNAIVFYTADNAEQHHSRGWRYPVVLLGSAGGKLKSDGRYIKYPCRAKTRSRTPDGGPATVRALGDLISSLSHALDAPVDNWGKDGLEKVQGPLSEVLA